MPTPTARRRYPALLPISRSIRFALATALCLAATLLWAPGPARAEKDTNPNAQAAVANQGPQVLLILLTANEQLGDRASFALQVDMASCQEKPPVMRKVFKKSGIEVLQIHCVESQQRFSKFSHKVVEGSPVHYYLLTYGPKGGPPKVRAMADAATCDAKRKARLKKKKGRQVYCATSQQELLSD